MQAIQYFQILNALNNYSFGIFTQEEAEDFLGNTLPVIIVNAPICLRTIRYKCHAARNFFDDEAIDKASKPLSFTMNGFNVMVRRVILKSERWVEPAVGLGIFTKTPVIFGSFQTCLENIYYDELKEARKNNKHLLELYEKAEDSGRLLRRNINSEVLDTSFNINLKTWRYKLTNGKSVWSESTFTDAWIKLMSIFTNTGEKHHEHNKTYIGT